MRNKTLVGFLSMLFWVYLPVAAGTIEVSPTGTSADFEAVRAAIASAQPGDTILLRAGVFDWSGNIIPAAPLVVPFGLPITVSNITIAGETGPNGELLVQIVGPVTATGQPALYPSFGANAAFINAPAVEGVTVRNLVLKNFESAIHLVQAPPGGLDFLAPGTDFSSGADDFVIEGLRIENTKQGITLLGANDRLIVRNNRIQIVRIDGTPLTDEGGLFGSTFAIALISGRSSNRAVPVDLVFEGNTLLGPGPELTFVVRPNGSTLGLGTFGLSIEGGLGLRMENNHVEQFAFGLQFGVEGAVRVVGNLARGCQLGMNVGDFTPVDAFSATHDALIRNNRSVESVALPRRPDGGSQNPIVSGVGIAVSAKNNHFVGNNVQNNATAGIALLEAVGPGGTKTATGNLILGNKNVVIGSEFVLANNTISGSQKSIRKVGNVVSQLVEQGGPPFFPLN